MSVLRQIAEQLVAALRPLEQALTDPGSFRSLMLRLGWRASTIPPEWSALGTSLASLESSVAALVEDPELKDVIAAVAAANDLRTHLGALTTAPPGLDRDALLAELRGLLVERLIIDQFARDAPRTFGLLMLFGLIHAERQAASSNRPAHTRYRFDTSQLAALVRDPSSLSTLIYGWGTANFDAERITGLLFDLLIRLGLPARIERSNGALPGYPSLAIGNHSIRVPLLDLLLDGSAFRLGIAIAVIPPAASGPGLTLAPWIPGLTDGTMQLGSSLQLRTTGSSGSPIELALMITSAGLDVHFPGSGGTLPAGGIGIECTIASPGRIGSATGSRFEFGGITVGIQVDRDDQWFARAGVKVDGAQLVIAASDQDSFVAQLLGGQEMRTLFPLGLQWSSRHGFELTLGPGTLGVPGSITLGPLRFDNIALALAADEPYIDATVSSRITASLGPLTVVLDRLGWELKLDRSASGTLGLGSLNAGVALPIGAGLTIDASGVTGGGFLRRDPAKSEYSGVLQLQYVDLALQAFGLITTQVAGGSGYSLLALVDAEFPPVQLGWGFTLNGVGGLLAVHRTASIEALHAALKAGQLSSILFPKNAITNAPVILGQLDALFPTAPGRFLFGPMALIDWGTPTMLTAAIAVVLELPEPIRIILLARIEARLPEVSDDAPVRINMDALGVLDLSKDELSFDAVLFDSKLVGFTLSGNMALRATWARQREFLLAIGGVHPRFTPPAGFPALQRITIDMPSGSVAKLRLAAYLALTSNAIQFGANLDVSIEVSGFGLIGHLGFDALLHRHPFRFEADISGMVAIKAGSHDLASVSLDARLSGPAPYHIAGKFKVHVLLVDVHVSFNRSWGEEAPLLPVPSIDVGEHLRNELADVRSWDALLPDGMAPLVSLRQIANAGRVLAHPLARPGVHERIVPLGLAITRFGEAVPTGDTQFAITGLQVGSVTFEPKDLTAIQDDFAPAQFFELSDEDKLARPAFERYDAGVRATGGSAMSGTSVPKSTVYETYYVDTPGGVPRSEDPTPPPSLSDLAVILPFSSAAHAAARSPGQRYQAPGNPIQVAEPAFVLADRNTMAAAGIGPVAGTTFSAVQALMGRRRDLQIVATHELAA